MDEKQDGKLWCPFCEEQGIDEQAKGEITCSLCGKTSDRAIVDEYFEIKWKSLEAFTLTLAANLDNEGKEEAEAERKEFWKTRREFRKRIGADPSLSSGYDRIKTFFWPKSSGSKGVFWAVIDAVVPIAITGLIFWLIFR